MSRQTRNNIKSKNMDLALNKGNVIYTNKRTSIELLDKDNASPPKNSKLNEAITLSHLANNIETTLSLVGEEMPKNQFSKARRALHQNEGIVLTGREKEFIELDSFFDDLILNNKSGSIYISGAPGTGKTATLTKLASSERYKKENIVFVNCTSISTIGAIYKKIYIELKLKINANTEKDYAIAVESYFRSNNKMTILVLDEIDQLAGKKQSILYRIFSWPAIQNSKLILVGIANALDLTDRLLSRLQTKCELKPKLMHFSAYSKQQIIEIFKSRLEMSGVSGLFPPGTIQLLAGKVSSVSGDIRRALHIGSRVVELAEKSKLDGGSIDIRKIERDCLESIAPIPLPIENSSTVRIRDLVSVLNTVYGTSQQLDLEMEEFPLQQKILVCTLLLIMKHDKNKDVTMFRLYDIFKKVCKNKNILAVDQSEFVSLCTLVETRGILRIQKKKEPRLHKVYMQWDQEEVFKALKDKQMITNIINDKTVLNK